MVLKHSEHLIAVLLVKVRCLETNLNKATALVLFFLATALNSHAVDFSTLKSAICGGFLAPTLCANFKYTLIPFGLRGKHLRP